MKLYEPNGRDIEEINIGENNKPHLFDITGGEREGGLSFHFKLGDKFFEAEIADILSNAVILRCKKRQLLKCLARHKLKIDPKFIVREKNGTVLAKLAPLWKDAHQVHD